MAGFVLNLKGKKPEPKPGKVAFSLGKKPVKKETKVSILHESDSEDEGKISIDSFDGAQKEEVKKQLVIRQDNLNTTITKSNLNKDTKVAQQEEAPQEESMEAIARNAILNDEHDSSRVIAKASKKTGEENTLDSYNEVPVEDFGAALLRGMGWKPKKGAVQKPKVNNRQQGLLLGIGAKPIKDNDLAQELLSSKAKFTVPLVKRDLKTGKIEDN